MNYEVVNLKEKTVVGLEGRTSNMDPNISSIIGGLWNDFYQKGFYNSIQNKANTKALGIYSDFENNEKGSYNVTVGCEVTSADQIPESVVVRTIPEGNYAKFIVHGHMQKAVAAFWESLWKMDLDRKFECDFEEYQDCDMENAEIHIYISLKS